MSAGKDIPFVHSGSARSPNNDVFTSVVSSVGLSSNDAVSEISLQCCNSPHPSLRTVYPATRSRATVVVSDCRQGSVITVHKLTSLPPPLEVASDSQVHEIYCIFCYVCRTITLTLMLMVISRYHSQNNDH